MARPSGVKPVARCLECRRKVTVRADGGLHTHATRPRGGEYPCPGSGQPVRLDLDAGVIELIPTTTAVPRAGGASGRKRHMIGEAPDIREQEDCPSGDVCEWACDMHEAQPGADPVTRHDEPAEGDVAGVAEVLAAHFIMWRDLDRAPLGEWFCECGLTFGFSFSAIEHVADALRALLDAAEQRGRVAAWGEGHRAGWMDRNHDRPVSTPNPYRATVRAQVTAPDEAAR